MSTIFILLFWIFLNFPTLSSTSVEYSIAPFTPRYLEIDDELINVETSTKPLETSIFYNESNMRKKDSNSSCLYRVYVISWKAIADIYMKEKLPGVKDHVYKQPRFLGKEGTLGNELYFTKQFSLAAVIYEKLSNSPCATDEIQEANIVFMPMFPWSQWWIKSPKRSTIKRVIEFLDQTIPASIINRSHGRSAPMLVTVWPFSLYDPKKKIDQEAVGTGIILKSSLSYLQESNVLARTRILMIETSAWEGSQHDIRETCHHFSYAVPYPSHSHPSRPSLSLHRRISHNISCIFTTDVRNDSLPRNEIAIKLRSSLLDQCNRLDGCVTASSMSKDPVGRFNLMLKQGLAKKYMEIYLQSKYCIQPPGDTSSRKGIFDSLTMGCVPVLLFKWQATQYLYLYPDLRDIFLPVIPPISQHHRVLKWILENEHNESFQIARLFAQKMGQRFAYSSLPLHGFDCDASRNSCDALEMAMWKLFQEHQKDPLLLHPPGKECKEPP